MIKNVGPSRYHQGLGHGPGLGLHPSDVHDNGHGDSKVVKIGVVKAKKRKAGE